MKSTHVSNAAGRAALVEAAVGTFVRFGFSKTSMDEVARAAGMSRQGVYFHFSTKEELFREVIRRLADAVLSALTETLARTGIELEERLYKAFMAMNDAAFGRHDEAQVQEMFSSAPELCPDIVKDLDRRIIAAVSDALGGPPRGAFSARELAEHLYVTSYGFKHRSVSRHEYASRMKIAVRIVCAAQRPGKTTP